MRKVFILLLAVSLFTSCKDKKVDRRDDRRSERDRDDYRSGDDDRDKDRNSKDADYNDDRNNDDRNSRDRDNSDDSRNSGGGWTSAEVKIFVDNCVSSAADGGMQRSKAEDYCNCMQKVLEKDYPNANDVGNVNMESSRMKAAVKDCLGM